MTDKELIKQEIEKQIDSVEDDTRYTESYRQGLIAAYQTVKAFIDSLPEEPASEDLEEEAKKFYTEIECYPPSLQQYSNHVEKAFKAGAEWQKQKDYKMYAHVPLKDIHDAWQELKNNKQDIENYPAICFQKGADWRENQMKESLQTEYEKGRFDMREEMMKALIGGEITKDIHNQLNVKSEPLNDTFGDIKFGDKVKIVIIKQE